MRLWQRDPDEAEDRQRRILIFDDLGRCFFFGFSLISFGKKIIDKLLFILSLS